MALIRYKRGVYCDKCEKLVPRGESVYYTGWNYYCEECFDQRQQQEKQDARTGVNKENFDLEVEE